MDKKTKARILHSKGYNCAQSVACAFAEELDLPEKTLFRLTEGLGFGMGCGKGVCGALSAAVMAAGVKSSTANLDFPNSKKDTYRIAAEMTRRFEETAGSIICREIKSETNGTPLYPCGDCIDLAVEILEKYFKNEL